MSQSVRRLPKRGVHPFGFHFLHPEEPELRSEQQC